MKSGTVFVTGGAGFIGSHLVNLLVDQGLKVKVLSYSGTPNPHLPDHGVDLIPGDIRDRASVEKAAQGCEIVLHLAANPNLWAKNSGDFELVNHQGTRNVLEAAKSIGAKRIVHVSTESILTSDRPGVINDQTVTRIEDMIGPYCRSKWQAEEAARQAAREGLPVVIASPTVPIGAGDRHMGPPTRMVRDFCNGKFKAYLDAEINLIDVRDSAEGIWAAALKGEIGRRYLLSNENWTVKGIFDELGRMTGSPAPRHKVPYWLALSFAYAEEWVCTNITGRTPMATVTGVKLTRRAFRFDGSRSASDLGLKYRPCAPALKDTVDWLKAEGQIEA